MIRNTCFIICVAFFASSALAAPSISVTPLPYNPAHDTLIWEVRITPDDPSHSLAIELPMVLTPITPTFNTVLTSGGDATNGPTVGTWYYNETAAGSGVLVWNTQQDVVDTEQNFGNNPFTGTETEGLQLDTAMKRLFAALGSATNLPDADGATPGTQVATIHIAAHDGRWTWTDAIVAEDGVNYTLSGSRSSVIRGDINGSMSRNFLDVAAFGQLLGNRPQWEQAFAGLDAVARADMNGNGTVNFLDVAGFGNCLSNPASCPPNPGSGAALDTSTSIPEPTSLALLALGMLAIICTSSFGGKSRTPLSQLR